MSLNVVNKEVFRLEHKQGADNIVYETYTSVYSANRNVLKLRTESKHIEVPNLLRNSHSY